MARRLSVAIAADSIICSFVSNLNLISSHLISSCCLLCLVSANWRPVRGVEFESIKGAIVQCARPKKITERKKSSAWALSGT